MRVTSRGADVCLGGEGLGGGVFETELSQAVSSDMRARAITWIPMRRGIPNLYPGLEPASQRRAKNQRHANLQQDRRPFGKRVRPGDFHRPDVSTKYRQAQ